MGEYVININWSGGKGSGGSKGNTTPTAFLEGATPTAIAANTLFHKQAKSIVISDKDGYIERYYEKAHE